jgi:hypothetical protein
MVSANGGNMSRSGRRLFLQLLGASAAVLRGAREVVAQAPPKAALPEDARRRELAVALRELNAKAGLGVAAEDLDRAEAYATGALVEAETKLRGLTLPEGLELPVTFHAQRRS